MTRGVRWLVGSGFVVLLLGAAVFVGLFGGIWSAVGGVGRAAVPEELPGTVTAVDVGSREVTVRFTSTTGTEVTDVADWSGTGGLPDLGDEVAVTTSPTDPDDAATAGRRSEPAFDFFSTAGVGLLVLAGVLVLLAVAALVATAVWAGRARPGAPPGRPTATLRPQDDDPRTRPPVLPDSRT